MKFLLVAALALVCVLASPHNHKHKTLQALKKATLPKEEIPSFKADEFDQALMEEMVSALPIPPHNPGQPVEVAFNAVVKSVFEIKEAEEEFHVQLLVSLEWTDSRISGGTPTGSKQNPDAVWDPDLQVTNAIKTEVRKEKVMAYPKNLVRKSKRMYLTLRAHMDYTGFPFDSHVWMAKMNSFTYTTEDFIFVPGTVTLADDLSHPMWEFTQGKVIVVDVESLLVPGKTFSTVVTQLYVKRMSSSFVSGVIFPINCIILLTYLSFWVNPEDVPARMTLCIIAFLTLTFLNGKVSSVLPKIAYLTWADAYMFVSLLTVGASLVLFIMVHRKSKFRTFTKASYDKKTDEEKQQQREEYKESTGEEWETFVEQTKQPHNDPQDVKARVWFPIVWGVLNLIFLIIAFAQTSSEIAAADDASE